LASTPISSGGLRRLGRTFSGLKRLRGGHLLDALHVLTDGARVGGKSTGGDLPAGLQFVPVDGFLSFDNDVVDASRSM
jgi:hypothetical protein